MALMGSIVLCCYSVVVRRISSRIQKRAVENATMMFGSVCEQMDSTKEICMDKDYMDASIGLQFSLELLKRYRESGLLQAQISGLPGISGKGNVEITILQGDVTSCLARDQQGRPFRVDLEVLLRLEKVRGPFGWNLFPFTQGEQRVPVPQHLSHSLPRQEPGLLGENTLQTGQLSSYLIPCITAKLRFKQVAAWTPNQKHALLTIYSLVDGKRTVEDIKRDVSFSSQYVEKGLRVLAGINVIRISS